MSNNYESGWLGNFEVRVFFGFKHISFRDLLFGRRHFENCIQLLKMGRNFIEMNAGVISDTCQLIIE